MRVVVKPSIGDKCLERAGCRSQNGQKFILRELQAVLHYDELLTYLDRQPELLCLHATNFVGTNLGVLLAGPMTGYLKAEASKRVAATPVYHALCAQASLADLY